VGGAIGLTGAYTLTGAGCKGVFSKGVLLVTRIWGCIGGGDRVKHQDLEVMSQFGGEEEFRPGTIKEGTTNTIVN